MNDKIKFAITTIILGALGSGLWTHFGDPTVGWFGEKYIHIAQRLNHEFADYFHSTIGEGMSLAETTETSQKISLLFAVIVMIFGFMTRFHYFFESGPQKVTSIFGTLMFFLGTVMVLQTSALSIKNGYNNRAVMFLERSIEILSASNDEKTILQLRAQYRSIENANDFYLLHDKLVELANRSNVKLPIFEVAR